MGAYVTIKEAKAITDVALSQTLLDEANAIVHGYTPYRWTETTITKTVSGKGESDRSRLILESPIISVGSLVVDTITLTEDTDFKLRSDDGIIEIFSGWASDSDNLVITYSYGFTSSHRNYADTIPLVRGAEARIALYLKRNPAMLTSLGVTGATIGFAEDQLNSYLARVPKPAAFMAV